MFDFLTPLGEPKTIAHSRLHLCSAQNAKNSIVDLLAMCCCYIKDFFVKEMTLLPSGRNSEQAKLLC